MKYGFRPLAGIMALIGIMIYLNNDGTDCFRPLTGIMVLIKYTASIIIPKSDTKFPSPYGDYGSYQFEREGKQLLNQPVSVPLRGLWFLSAPFINAFMKPSKWHFAGRIIYFHHFLSFARK